MPLYFLDDKSKQATEKDFEEKLLTTIGIRKNIKDSISIKIRKKLEHDLPNSTHHTLPKQGEKNKYNMNSRKIKMFLWSKI